MSSSIEVNESAHPVDNANEVAGCNHQCVDRREFISSGLIATALAMLATACAKGPQSVEAGPAPSVAAPPPEPPADVLVVKLADQPELAKAGGVATLKDEKLGALAVVRGEGDKFVALSLLCTHKGGLLALKDTEWVCPLHRGRFAKEGKVMGGPPAKDMNAYPATYDAAKGTVTIKRTVG
jgi:Rieske Fe-S protein